MRTMPFEEIEQRLGGSHQAILSVSRTGRGPLAVPMSFLFDGNDFLMITSPDSQHGKLMRKTGRATLTIQDEALHDRSVDQWYVMAEGSIEFTGVGPLPLLRAILAKDRGEHQADEWTEQSSASVTEVAVLRPATLNGYFGTSKLP